MSFTGCVPQLSGFWISQRWLLAIQSRLQIGQRVEYFDAQANSLKRGQVLKLCRKQAQFLDQDDDRRWLIPYAAINLDGADVQIR